MKSCQCIRQPFGVSSKSSESRCPGKASFYYPALGQEHKDPLGFGEFHDTQFDPFGFRRLCRALTHVTLIDIGNLHALPGLLLYCLGELPHLVPVATVAEVIAPITQALVFDADSRLLKQLAVPTLPAPAPIPRKQTETDDARERRGWCALFSASWSELERYRHYLAGNSDLATHQVVKGSEFTHVMVVMDDKQAGGQQFSYDKLFGAAESGERDLENFQAGKETTIDRSLRLLYVTCSRACESVGLVLWAEKPAEALEFARHKSGWFEAKEVVEIAWRKREQCQAPAVGEKARKHQNTWESGFLAGRESLPVVFSPQFPTKNVRDRSEL